MPLGKTNEGGKGVKGEWESANQCILPLEQKSSRYFAVDHSPSKRKSQVEDDDENKPLEYFGSQASSWQAFTTRSGPDRNEPWYQSYVIMVSVVTFLVYFCVLREESDIDRKLEGNLFDQVPGLERTQLIIYYRYCQDRGMDTQDIEKKLLQMGVDVKELDLIN